MKSPSNFLLFAMSITLLIWSLECHGRNLIVISYSNNLEMAQLAEKILLEKKHIPPALVILKKEISNHCPIERESIVQICIEDNGEISTPVINKNSLEAFKIFYQRKQI